MSNTKTSSSLKTLCRTAIFLALLIAVQFVTRSMGQYVTGSLVNLILIASGLMCGLWGGLAVAVLSPICAFFIGIGPAFPQVVPAVALGNAVLVLLWVLIAGAKNAPIARQAIALVVAAVAKFLTIFFTRGLAMWRVLCHAGDGRSGGPSAWIFCKPPPFTSIFPQSALYYGQNPIKEDDTNGISCRH